MDRKVRYTEKISPQEFSCTPLGHGKSEYLGLNEENEKENRDEATQEYGGAVPQTMYNYLQYLSRGDIDRKRERRKSKG